MIPDDKAERERLLEWIWRDLVAEWFVVDHSEAHGHCVHEPTVEKFREMADRVVRSVERYEVGLPFPEAPKNRRTVVYQNEDGTPYVIPPKKPTTYEREDEPQDEPGSSLFGG